jgi:hypothetical protein
MFCAHCGSPLNYKDLNDDGWCEHCTTVVNVSQCKVSFWNLMAVGIMAWTLTIGA